MKVALIGDQGELGAALARALGGEHEVAVAGDGDLRDEAFATQVVAGASALVYLVPPALHPGGLASQATGATADGERIDLATRGTYVLLQAAVAAGVRRVVLCSTLDFFERYPAGWTVSEGWQPLPDVADVTQLAAYLAEESAKQFARVEPLSIVGLRLGTVVDDATVGDQPYDPRWLHVDDAVQAVTRALHVAPATRGAAAGDDTAPPRQGWWVYHIPGGGKYTRFPLNAAAGARGLGYAPAHDFGASPGASTPPPALDGAAAAGDLSLIGPRQHIPTRPIRNVVVFGAGGPLAAATTRVLAATYRLRLTDVRSLAEIVADGKPQSLGAPLPAVLGPPHEMMAVDVADPEAVQRACVGMDAIVNCTVVRPHPVQAFRVNCLGAYNVMRAAVANGIRRVVHTGPQLVTNDRPAGYWWDFDVPDDAPPRPGTSLYGHSKYLGQEMVRLFAEQYDLQVPVLLFSSFVDPATASAREGGVFAMSVSWDDAGHAMRRALEAPTLPRPLELFHILADLPHGKYDNAKARRLLGWQPRDNLARLWAGQE